ncbi:hypothetical protein ACIGKL_13365 [Pseudomonas sp. NPDC077186]|uniref:hypothetical protein n=1 Tax=Pseudomonas sp. NPDC077186 TaxID=3364421 RepID=UPI0037C62804
MIDDLDGLGNLLGRLLQGLLALLRMAIGLIVEGALDLLFNRLTYCLGWLTLRGLSLGQRPRMPWWPADLDRQVGARRLQLLGGACLLGLIAWAMLALLD